MVKTAEIGGRKAGEKASGFSVTCSLLSQYLKEKGGLADLALSISAPAAAPPVEGRGTPEVPRIMNLLPGVEAVGGGADAATSDRRGAPALSMDLFPQRAGFAPSDEKKPDLVREAQRGQMTIFYGGKVVVFDNFPADKAREMMAMAGRGCPAPAQRLKGEQAAPAPAPAPVAPQRPSGPLPTPHNSAAAVTGLTPNSEAKPVAAAAAAASPSPAVTATQEAPQQPAQPAASDLPIARRASLHRFLEKRKDRISAKAPYPVSVSPAASASPAKLEETRKWLGLASGASQPEGLHG